MTTETKKTEADLAAIVVRWLTDMRWDVYQEVQFCQGGRVADIVATQNGILWVIECKTSLGLAVIEQAEWWTTWANLASVATPVRQIVGWSARSYSARSKQARSDGFADRVAGAFGIGSLRIAHGEIREALRPVLRRRVMPDLRDCLTPEMKHYAEAGNAAGRFFSPFKATCDNLRRYLAEHPGATIKAAVEGIEHHYRAPATARSCLAHWIVAGKVKGVEARYDGKRYRLYLTGTP